jgi:hypothetical protein
MDTFELHFGGIPMICEETFSEVLGCLGAAMVAELEKSTGIPIIDNEDADVDIYEIARSLSDAQKFIVWETVVKFVVGAESPLTKHVC